MVQFFYAINNHKQIKPVNVCLFLLKNVYVYSKMSLERKIKGSVKSENIFKESVRKEEAIRLNWAVNWQWYIDLLREREKIVADYKKSSPKALALGAMEKPDPRSVLPFPVTTSKNYGWLASKKEFQLETVGPYFENIKLTANAPDASSSIFYSTSNAS